MTLLAFLGAAVLASTGCSIKKFAVGQVAGSLTSGPDVFGTDDDPELVRDALPFGLKLLENLLTMVPDHEGLLATCCRGYTQYAFAFVQMDADAIESTDRARANELRERALKLYLRARGYGLRALERRHRGISDQLIAKPEQAVARLKARELPAIFWTAAAWGAAISIAKDRPELTADIESVRSLMGRALALDADYERGIVHEVMIALEGLPEMMGGSRVRARDHFQKAIALSKGDRVAPFVILAESVSIPAQDRAEFRHALGQAIAIDPSREPNSQLENILLQRKARLLLAREDELFLEPDTTSSEESP